MDAVGGSESIRILGDEPLRKRATGFRFTEGAVWRGDDRVVIFSDIPSNRLYRFDPSTEQVALYREPSNLTNGNVFESPASAGQLRARHEPRRPRRARREAHRDREPLRRAGAE